MVKSTGDGNCKDDLDDAPGEEAKRQESPEENTSNLGLLFLSRAHISNYNRPLTFSAPPASQKRCSSNQNTA